MAHLLFMWWHLKRLIAECYPIGRELNWFFDFIVLKEDYLCVKPMLLY